jgi:hypothetical protein
MPGMAYKVLKISPSLKKPQVLKMEFSQEQSLSAWVEMRLYGWLVFERYKNLFITE